MSSSFAETVSALLMNEMQQQLNSRMNVGGQSTFCARKSLVKATAVRDHL